MKVVVVVVVLHFDARGHVIYDHMFAFGHVILGLATATFNDFPAHESCNKRTYIMLKKEVRRKDHLSL